MNLDAAPVDPAPVVDALRGFMGDWMATREAFSPVLWRELRRVSGTRLDRAQFELLRFVVHEPSMSLKDLAAATMTTTSTASRLVDCLVNEGMLVRNVPSDDRRVTRIEPTPAGCRLVELSESIGASLLAGPFSAFAIEEIRAFGDTFRKLAPAMRAWARDPGAWALDAQAHRDAAPAAPSNGTTDHGAGR